MKSEQLLDTWAVSGKSVTDFGQIIKDIDAHTFIVPFETDSINLMSRDETEDSDSRLGLCVHSKEQVLNGHLPAKTGINIKKCVEKNFPVAILEELRNKTRLAVRIGNNNTLFTASSLSRDLGALAKLTGEAIYDPTVERDAYLMSRYVKCPGQAKAIIREHQQDTEYRFRKVFALRTSAYQYIPQSMLLDIINNLQGTLGSYTCEEWSITNFMTQIWLSFPEKAKDLAAVYKMPDTLIPGVMLETSDTGDCCLRVTATWKYTRRGSAPVSIPSRPMLGVFEQEHRGKFDQHDIMRKLDTELIPKYTMLPERLCELLTVDIPDPEAAIETVIHMLRLNKVIGKKRAVNIQEALLNEIAPGRKMTGYDLSLLFMDIPWRYAGEGRYKKSIERLSGTVPFLDFDKIAKSTTKVILAPAS